MKEAERARAIALAEAVAEVGKFGASGGKGDALAESCVAGYNDAVRAVTDALLGLLRETLQRAR